MDSSLLLIIEETKKASGAKMAINNSEILVSKRNVIESNSESTGIKSATTSASLITYKTGVQAKK